MPKNKKKFNKKNATTYSIVSRTLDPIGEDGDGTDEKGRLVVNGETLLQHKEEEHKYGIYFDDDYNYLRHLRDVGSFQGQLEEHEPNPNRLGQSASHLLWESLSVAASEIGREGRDGRSGVGSVSGGWRDSASRVPLKWLAGPIAGPSNMEAEDEVDVDPEVAAALEDEEFDFDNPENVLNDDFVLLADGRLAPEDVSDGSKSDYEDDGFPGVNDVDFEEDRPSKRNNVILFASGQFGNVPDRKEMIGAWMENGENNSTAAMIRGWVAAESQKESSHEPVDAPDEEETRSRFSRYSMTSSVVRRTQGLKDLDDHFEQMFSQYDEEMIGGLDLDEHESACKSRVLDSILQGTDVHPESCSSGDEGQPERDEVALKFAFEANGEDDGELEGVIVEEEPSELERLDCQSIISRTSTRSFQPRIIPAPLPRKIRLNRKTGIPLELCTDDPSESSSEEDEDREDVLSMISSISVARPKDETPEQRRLRKQTLKQLRRERRCEKKTSRMAFAAEKIRQQNDLASVNSRLKTVPML